MAVEMIPTNPRIVVPSPWKLYMEGVILSIPVKVTIVRDLSTVCVDALSNLLVRSYIYLLVDSKVKVGWVDYLIAERIRPIEVGDYGALCHSIMYSIVFAMSFIASRSSGRWPDSILSIGRWSSVSVHRHCAIDSQYHRFTFIWTHLEPVQSHQQKQY